MSDRFELTEEERAGLLPSGRSRTMDNRVGWSISHLSQAGLLDRPARGQVTITAAGQDVLAAHPERVDTGVLLQFASYRDFRSRSNARVAEGEPPLSSKSDTEAASPQDLLAQAVTENRAAVEGELLKRALALPPTEFERLVVRLLEQMGYGRSGMVEHSGRSGDAGIDGIISQDPLGLDRIYLQAKRYAPDQSVQRPAIQGFVGALMGAQGDRGVFITTSSFSSGARAEAERVNARIELIDGARLAELMLRHGVGVQPETTVTLHQLDEDFFESL
ncbi:restriction endonuclease [Klenkia sp. LSe6-5]|uniref:Restriction endonuclease n=1 Tax=Klenkia sesuvii TaxID=3103137 RepID=A0ABU8DZX9_9ACTN